VLLQNRYAYIQALDKEYVLSKRTIEAYQAWKANVRGIFGNPQDEFCLQTAYIHFVRLFFVRVCEDHGLIPRRISNGPFARYEELGVLGVPATLDAVKAFMGSIDVVKTQGEQIRATINALLTEIEGLVEATYKEPAFLDKMTIINKVAAYGENRQLF